MTRNAALFLTSLGLATVAVVYACSSSSTTSRGEEVYAEYCARCHYEEGSSMLPPGQLVKSWADANAKERLITALLYGASGSMHADSLGRRRGMPPMPYGDADVAAVASYVLGSETDEGRQQVTTRDVKRVREYKQGLQESAQ